MKTPTIPRGRYVLQRLAPPSVSAPGFSHPVESSARVWARYALQRLVGANHPPSVSVRSKRDVLRQADQEAERRTWGLS